MSRFAVAKNKLRRPTVAEGRPEFLCSGSSLFFFSNCVCFIKHQQDLLEQSEIFPLGVQYVQFLTVIFFPILCNDLPSFSLSICPTVSLKVQILQIMHRFAVAESKLRRSPKQKIGLNFFVVTLAKKGEIVFSFNWVCLIDHQSDLLEQSNKFVFGLICAIPNSFIFFHLV